MMSEVNLQDWVGRQQRVTDLISFAHAKKIAYSVNAPVPAEGGELPHLWHWAYFIEAAPLDELGEDGHPARGGFLPPADNRNRMWAGGRLSFVRNLVIGKEAACVAAGKAVVEKGEVQPRCGIRHLHLGQIQPLADMAGSGGIHHRSE